jgi:hypothetical protein
MVARKRNPPTSHTIYALLACAAITVAPFVNGCRPCRLAKKAEIGWQTARLCSKVHRIDRPDRQSRRRSLVTGTITMIIIGVLLNIIGLGVFCWALSNGD